jgi:hypothetical protein
MRVAVEIEWSMGDEAERAIADRLLESVTVAIPGSLFTVKNVEKGRVCDRIELDDGKA